MVIFQSLMINILVIIVVVVEVMGKLTLGLSAKLGTAHTTVEIIVWATDAMGAVLNHADLF